MPKFVITEQYVVQAEGIQEAAEMIGRYNADLVFQKTQQLMREPLVTRRTLSFFDPTAGKAPLEEFLAETAGAVLRAEGEADHASIAQGIADRLREMGFVQAADLVQLDIPNFANEEDADELDSSSGVFEGLEDVDRLNAPEALGGRF